MLTSNILQELLVPWNGSSRSFDLACDLSKKLGWYPSDIIESKRENNIATGHLFVEHGLDNAAVISFINSKYPYNENVYYQTKNKIKLLELSYNNLIDYHIIVDTNNIRAFHNRESQNDLIYANNTQNFETALNSDYFTDIIEQRTFKPDILALDNALIKTISYWKRYIYSELNGNISYEELSNFFNAIIFARALEDNRRSLDNNTDQFLVQNLWNNNGTITNTLEAFFSSVNINWPDNVIDKSLLCRLDSIDNYTLSPLLSDFYKLKETPYNYDFSIISKHALSLIYEKYVAVLKMPEDKGQHNLFDFSPNPIEEINKPNGSYYTPQFIARFFSRYIENISPDLLQKKDLKILEPSVGSGTFIRTLLEAQIELNKNGADANFSLFNNFVAIDKNDAACDATTLSLSLLHLVTKGEMPKQNLNVINIDALEYFSKHQYDRFDVIITNPPYVRYNSLNSIERQAIKSFLSEYSFNKSDLYLAFVKIGISNLAENGIGLFVLPSTFLITDSAKHIRRYLQEECNIRCIVDLSNVENKIFEEADIYPILIIFQKKDKLSKIRPLALIANIKENIGKALTELLNNKCSENREYCIYSVSQDFFKFNEQWQLLPPEETKLMTRLSKMRMIEDFFEVRTGFSTGKTDAFIRPLSSIPKKEISIYRPYLSDREMLRYNVPENVQEYVFYPYIHNKKIDEETLKHEYPLTYSSLKRHYNDLVDRSEVKNGRLEWWMPNRSRKPEFMFLPKIVIPHLIFIPRFSFDMKGIFAVSRSPFLVPKSNCDVDLDFLFYILGVLNSSLCTWFLLKKAPTYQNGYVMLEPKTVSNLPILDPQKIEKKLYMRFISIVKERFVIKDSDFNRIVELDKIIDQFVFDIYQLNSAEIKVIIGDYGN